MKWVLALGALGMSAGVALTPMMMTSTMGMATAGGSAYTCTTHTPGTAGQITALDDPEQRTNAQTIIGTGRALKVPDRGLIVAIATALQESTLKNIDYGDRDSIGIFQQRADWGTRTQRLDPAQAAAMFYTGGHAGQRGLLDLPGWQLMTITAAAQAVQVSAYPSAYAKWETLARAIVDQTGDGAAPPPTCAAPEPPAEAEAPAAVQAMLTAALAQQGDPYVYGATGPDSFDCSGLVIWAWKQAGYRVNMRTAADMYLASDPVQPGEEKPGDMVFSGWGETRPGAGHVEIVVKRGLVVEAPHTGDVVKLRHYTATGSYKLARFKPSAMTRIG